MPPPFGLAVSFRLLLQSNGIGFPFLGQGECVSGSPLSQGSPADQRSEKGTDEDSKRAKRSQNLPPLGRAGVDEDINWARAGVCGMRPAYGAAGTAFVWLRLAVASLAALISSSTSSILCAARIAPNGEMDIFSAIFRHGTRFFRSALVSQE
jgi:hypothetical protein